MYVYIVSMQKKGSTSKADAIFLQERDAVELAQLLRNTKTYQNNDWKISVSEVKVFTNNKEFKDIINEYNQL